MSNQTSLQELQDTYSEYHKDLMGFRPHASDAEWSDEAWLRQRMSALDEHFKCREATFEGREQLREEGWVVAEETDPVLKAISEDNAAKRKARYAALASATY